jgi:hypothetical protein
MLCSNELKWGFDPLRYYSSAIENIRKGYFSYNFSYIGIVYYNIIILKIFGVDPLVPLLTNSFLTFYAVLLLVRFIGDRRNIAKYGFLLLIPEVVSFNMMASREIICMSLITVFVIEYFELVRFYTLSKLVIIIISIFIVAFIRPPMAGMAIIGIYIYSLLSHRRKTMKNIIFMTVVVLILGMGFYFSTSLGSNFSSDYISESLSESVRGNNTARDDAKAGLTTALIPHNPVEYVVFGIIRSFAYVLPAPIMIRDFSNQFSFSDYRVYDNLTTILLFIFLPFVFLGIYNRKKMDNKIYYIMVLLVILFFAIGMSLTNLIHNRYRIVYDLFYFSFAIYCWAHRKSLRFRI